MPVYSIPPARYPVGGYRAGVNAGVPGGFIQYAGRPETLVTGLDPTGVVDAAPAIQAAINAANPETCVKLPAGTFRINSTLNFGWLGEKKGVTLRGMGQGNTILSYQGSGKSIMFGTESDWAWTWPPGVVVTDSPVRGATSFTVNDASALSVGELILIRVDNDPAIPVFSVKDFAPLQQQIVRMTGKSGNTVTFEPGLLFDLPAARNPFLRQTQFHLDLSGIESLTIDANNIPAGGHIMMQQAYRCWLYDVEVKNISNWGIYLYSDFFSEIRKCYVHPNASLLEPNHSGIIFGSTNSSNVIADNIVTGIFPSLEMFDSSSGNVIAYNFFIGPDSTLHVNHATHPSWNLYEGNVCTNFKQDGYFGGASNDTLFRNWFHGKNESGGNVWTNSSGRFGRWYNLVGNVIDATSYSTGNPNINNWSSNGVASELCAPGTLSTRTSDTAGELTVPSGHGVLTGAVIDLVWAEFLTVGSLTGRVSKVRRGVTVGTVTSTTVPFSGGDGDPLPAANETILFPTDNTAIRAYPFDWDQSLPGVRKWTGVLTTRTDDTHGVITLGTGQIASFATHQLKTLNNTGGASAVWSPTSGNVLLYTGTISGDSFPFATASTAVVLPAAGTPITLYPSTDGFQEHDLDVLYTSLLKANRLSGGIQSVESLGGDTLPDSLGYAARPDWWPTSIVWPPVDPNNPPASYAVIPAGYRYLNGTGAGGETPTPPPPPSSQTIKRPRLARFPKRAQHLP